MSSGYREPVKVVTIKIHYVETDALCFKSVAQKLTGKDSTAVAAKAAELEQGFERKDDNGSCLVGRFDTHKAKTKIEVFLYLFK